MQWEPRGCYKLRKKVFVKKPFFVETVKKTAVLIRKGNFKAALDLCKGEAERKKLNLEVIGIGTRKVNNKNLLQLLPFCYKDYWYTSFQLLKKHVRSEALVDAVVAQPPCDVINVLLSV